MRSRFLALARPVGFFLGRSFSSAPGFVDSAPTVLSAATTFRANPGMLAALKKDEDLELSEVLSEAIKAYKRAAREAADTLSEGGVSANVLAAAYRENIRKAEALAQISHNVQAIENSTVAHTLLEVASQCIQKNPRPSLKLCLMIMEVYPKGVFLYDAADRVRKKANDQIFGAQELFAVDDGLGKSMVDADPIHPEVLHEEIRAALLGGRIVDAYAGSLQLREFPEYADLAHELVEGIRLHLRELEPSNGSPRP